MHKQLPNLNSIRAIAVLMVMVSHIELQKQQLGFANINLITVIFGSIGVTLFFVLSGFLITYLLFQEHIATGTIKIKGFYLRRILRIWPLYFLILLFGTFVYPATINHSGFILSILFLPNIAFMLNQLPGVIEPIWSLGVEEQFYLFHPHLFRQNSIKKIFNTLVIFFIAVYTIKYTASKMHWKLCSAVLYKARFDCMMIGGIMSIWIVNYQESNKYFKPLLSPSIILKKYFQINLYLLFTGYLFICIIKPSLYNDQFLSFFVAAIIGNLALNLQCIITVETRFLNFIGKISFGFYLLHKLIIAFILYLLKIMEVNSIALQNIYTYTGTLCFTTIIAFLSYKYYEGYFLQVKNKLSEIPSAIKLNAVL